MAGTNGNMDRVYSSFVDPLNSQSTVIIGAGIMGCASAYYLATSGNTKPDTIHLVEAAPELFASASGRAAGFIAPDCTFSISAHEVPPTDYFGSGFGPATASLGALSFKLHQELAAEHNGRENWSYSPSTGTSLMAGAQNAGGGEDWMTTGASRAQVAAIHEYVGEQHGPAWLTRREGDQIETLSKDGGVGQVYVHEKISQVGCADGATGIPSDYVNSFSENASAKESGSTTLPKLYVLRETTMAICRLFALCMRLARSTRSPVHVC
jgi:hypothetical protein